MTMKTELTSIESRRSGNGLRCAGARTALSAWLGGSRVDCADKAVRAPVGCGCAAFDVRCSMLDVRCFGSGRADRSQRTPKWAASLGVLAAEGASQCSLGGCAPRRSQRAFSLIEMIGVLAVIAILATALAPSFVRQMDKTAGDQESAALKSFGDALQQSIMRYRYIPSDADWASLVATESGVDTAAVTMNPRSQPRVFLIDPNLSIAGVAGLPYTQTNTGSVSKPVSPRVMILSSVGTPLPAVPATVANFTNIWNVADGMVPTAAPAFAGWNGSGNDLKIQRVDLSPLFVRLQLGWVASSHTWPSYSIDAATSLAVTNASADWPGYFIQNSILSLYNHGGELDSQQILIRDNTFVYDQDTWRGSIGGEFFLGGVDIASAVNRYLAAYPNVRAQNGANQQAVVVQSMITFMDRYSDWAAAGFPYNSSPVPESYSALVSAQDAMKTAVQRQYIQSGGYDPIQVNCQ
jgi:prepilin-type N-terminal cleavage/methylation domain-containing protein